MIPLTLNPLDGDLGQVPSTSCLCGLITRPSYRQCLSSRSTAHGPEIYTLHLPSGCRHITLQDAVQVFAPRVRVRRVAGQPAPWYIICDDCGLWSRQFTHKAAVTVAQTHAERHLPISPA